MGSRQPRELGAALQRGGADRGGGNLDQRDGAGAPVDLAGAPARRL
jgi:hypothetical protein